jgi:hypothetical protein
VIENTNWATMLAQAGPQLADIINELKITGPAIDLPDNSKLKLTITEITTDTIVVVDQDNNRSVFYDYELFHLLDPNTNIW